VAIRRITLADVAREAGASMGTVSRVLNGRAEAWRIAPATRERVLAAADRLRYVPDPTARALARGRNRTIGITTPSDIGAGLTLPFFEDFAAAAIEAAGGRDHYVLVVPRHGDERPFDPRAALHGAQVDGLILYDHAGGGEAARSLARLGIPAVVAGIGGEGDDDVPAVLVDHVGGGRQAARHLRAAGHQRIGIVGGPPAPPGWQVRFRAFADELGGVPPERVVIAGWQPEDGRQGMLDLLARQPDLTAVFAGSDLIAMGALAALRERGRRVPQDVALIGFGDFKASPYLDPPLTTIGWPLKEMGTAAVDMLLACILDEAARPRRLLMPMPLVVRASA
jgi:LacI family transcriptional regulator